MLFNDDAAVTPTLRHEERDGSDTHPASVSTWCRLARSHDKSCTLACPSVEPNRIK